MRDIPDHLEVNINDLDMGQTIPADKVITGLQTTASSSDEFDTIMNTVAEATSLTALSGPLRRSFRRCARRGRRP